MVDRQAVNSQDQYHCEAKTEKPRMILKLEGYDNTMWSIKSIEIYSGNARDNHRVGDIQAR